MITGVLLCLLGIAFIPEQVWCKWGFHTWMTPTYPYWGGCEQGTYCCDLRMKIVYEYKNGKLIKTKRVPFTDEDLANKEAKIAKGRLQREKQEFAKQLRTDMQSDDDCEELLP